MSATHAIGEPVQDTPTPSPTEGMAMNWMLDHILTHPADYDSAALPLRTIYTLNSVPHTSPADFKVLLMEHLSKLPAQPCTLPPPFLATFIEKCFPPTFENVDFDQALTALDYLRDLDVRRRKELAKALRNAGMHDKKMIALRARAAKIDNAYAKAIVGIRRWTLIHELSLTPFNKFNCIALLNTLYPLGEPPVNDILNATRLGDQRNGLWRYIGAVEKNGPQILDSVRDANGGWPALAETVRGYVKAAVDQIQRADELARPASFASFASDSSLEMEMSTSRGLNAQRSREHMRRGSADSSSNETEVSSPTKRSTLERIVKGLTRMTNGTKKPYSADWGRGSSEDVKMRMDNAVAV